MHGGRLVARMLSALDAPVFTLCGDHITAILDGCADEAIRIIDARDERGAGFMAQGWSLATGAPGLVVVTGGPGLAAAMGPITDASMAGVPMLVVTSRIRASEEGRGFPQDIDSSRIAGGIATVMTVRSADQIASSIAAAYAEARARRRPVVLEISLDAQLARAPDDVPPDDVPISVSPGATPVDAAAVAQAAELLSSARRPVAILGDGCFWSHAQAAASAVIQATGMPVFTTRAARGLVPDNHPFCLSQPNFLHEGVRAILDAADLLVVAGADMDITLAFGGLAPQAQLIRIDSRPERLSQNRVPDVAVAGNEAQAFEDIARSRALLGPPLEGWVEEARILRDRATATIAATAPIHPAALVDALAAAAPGPATFTIDAGALALWGLGGLPARGPGRLLTSFGTKSSTIGGGLPFAIAAKLARPDEPAIALVGDGALGYQALELDTAARHGIDVVAVVGNDASWGIVRQQMETAFGSSVAAELSPRRYDDLARALGAHGERVEHARDLASTLARALGRKGPVLVDVVIDRTVRHEAMEFVARLFAPDA
ncbi:MAG: thiamine pyrophosphate-binding protein [Actinomycetota bacterium]